MNPLRILVLTSCVSLSALQPTGITLIQSLTTRPGLTTSPLRALLMYLKNPDLGKRRFLSEQEWRLALQEKTNIETIVQDYRGANLPLPAALIAEHYARAEDYALRSLIGRPGAPIHVETLARYLMHTGARPEVELRQEYQYAHFLRQYGLSRSDLARDEFMAKYRTAMLESISKARQ